MAWIYPEFSDQAVITALQPFLRDNVRIEFDHDDAFRIRVVGPTDKGELSWSYEPDLIGSDAQAFADDVANRASREFVHEVMTRKRRRV